MSSIVLAIISALSWVALGDVSAHVGSAIALLVVWGLMVCAQTIQCRDDALGCARGATHPCGRHWRYPMTSIGTSGKGTSLGLVGIHTCMHLVILCGCMPSSPFDSKWRMARSRPSPPLALWFFGLLAQVSLSPDREADDGLGRCGGRLDARADPPGTTAAHGASVALCPSSTGCDRICGSGHMESLALLTLAAVHSRDRRRGGAAWAALGMGIKLLPGVLILRLWRYRPLRSWSHWVCVQRPPCRSWMPGLRFRMHLRGALVIQLRLVQLFELTMGSYARPVAILCAAILLCGQFGYTPIPHGLRCGPADYSCSSRRPFTLGTCRGLGSPRCCVACVGGHRWPR